MPMHYCSEQGIASKPLRFQVDSPSSNQSTSDPAEADTLMGESLSDNRTNSQEYCAGFNPVSDQHHHPWGS